MADFATILVDMGFDKEKSLKALEATGNKGVEAAMEWLLAHPDEPAGTSAPVSDNQNGGGGGGTAAAETVSAAGVGEAKSYKCEDCGKLFSNMETVEFHAAKTNHSNFTESTEEKKPLTEEEKAEQSRKLLELMKVKRAEREAKEKREEIEREKQRMASGKDLIEAKRRLQEQEMKELLEQRRREKIEEKAARDRVKAMIEQDKAARKAKQAAASGEVVTAPSPPVSARSSSDVPLNVVKKDYTDSKIQIRLPNGKTLVQSFKANEPLAAVRVYVEVNRGEGMEGPFNIMTSFPRRVFDEEDYAKPLQALGLVPTAVLIVTRAVV